MNHSLSLSEFSARVCLIASLDLGDLQRFVSGVAETTGYVYPNDTVSLGCVEGAIPEDNANQVATYKC